MTEGPEARSVGVGTVAGRTADDAKYGIVSPLASSPLPERPAYRNISPMLASRANTLFGDCGTQAYIQNCETVLNKHVDDLAPRRTFTVNGLPVDVRDAPIRLSTAGNHWARQRRRGRLDARPRRSRSPPVSLWLLTGRQMYWWEWQGG